MPRHNWLIYGANGYTGHLLAEQARREGLTPILAGRSPDAVHAVGSALGLECRVFDVQHPERTLEALADVAVVAHCAGPFSATSAPMIDACLASASHYVDITGEIGVFEAAHARDAQARELGVVVCPGVGFDVIPTDCLAACLHQAMPDARELALGFDTASGLSPGTAKTTVEGLSLGGKVRRGGVITDVPLGYKRRTIDFGRGQKSAVTIPWGDVATAYYSTAIDNIEVYLPTPPALAMGMRLIDPLRPLFGLPRVQDWLKQQVQARIQGPDQNARERLRTWVWGEVRNAVGQVKSARVETANGYEVTVHGALLAVRHLLAYHGAGGYFTPSRLLGARCVEQLPGSGSIVLA
ncbi:saccharopine dehydrogenase NADP-binding domain-containing protein [Pseudomonas sp. GD03944]|uniref:saccharopine dehydrogenase family protein n=1 Tax=Pseudomonas sp. GD03944 TaxID=2975409 RepID=UPI002448A6F5|nr:saccharopine dehydrogenase NADP-binding domain-containing protein [Pseudomonas sp. GD03944]MDH1262166.1 saccharopine dehydrogenase NADP-binding domain-containing protein [Pseudomonas sp. GD03944]